MSVAIDFTGSNGSPKNKSSLHYVGSDKRNDYERALAGVLDVLLAYDQDDMVFMTHLYLIYLSLPLPHVSIIISTSCISTSCTSTSCIYHHLYLMHLSSPLPHASIITSTSCISHLYLMPCVIYQSCLAQKRALLIHLRHDVCSMTCVALLIHLRHDVCSIVRLCTATHCNAMQRNVTHCNTLQHTGTHWNKLQDIVRHCNKVQHAATCYKQHASTRMLSIPPRQTAR